MESTLLMRKAIAEAVKARGRTHPNPAVGAVIEHEGEIVATGHTQPAGSAHAEIVALKSFAQKGLHPDGQTRLAVTMEPCSTEGRTGPCTEAILSSGIRRIVVGATDPNPAHRGRGLAWLRDHGLEVESGILEGDCSDLNLIFNWNMAHGTPFIAAKIATTLDGRIATRGGLSKWITGEDARADVHRWRRYFPAIAVGAGTALADDPSLTARIPGEDEWCPVRFVFDRNLVSFKDGLRRVYSDEWKDRTIIVSNRLHSDRIQALKDKYGLQFWAMDQNMEDGGLTEFCQRCSDRGISGVFLEGGAHLLSSFLEYQFIHYFFAYRSPKLLADTSGLAPFSGRQPETMKDTVTLSNVHHDHFGDDQLMRGFVVYP